MIQDITSATNSIRIPVVGLSVDGYTINQIRHVAPHLLRSDHEPFWSAGFLDTAMWTDTAEFRNPNYHERTDTPITLDYEFMGDVANAIVEVIRGART